jgi:nitroreductase
MMPMRIMEYHAATKHTPDSVRRAARPLDWDNMPDPFRHYEGTPILDLPADPAPPQATAIDVLRGAPCPRVTEDPVEWLSQLLFHAASISAAKKTLSGYRYALRVNPSSGNLHPTEFHLASPQGQFHYRVSSHALEQRAICVYGPLCFLLTTIAWLEALKYGNRAYRYCLLDAGHAWQALALAARAIGASAYATGQFADEDAATAYQLPDDEWPLLLIRIEHAPALAPAVDRKWIGGIPNRLSEEIIRYPMIESAHSAVRVLRYPASQHAEPVVPSPEFTGPGAGPMFGEVVRRRRSALDFRGGSESMTQEQLAVLLDLATRPLEADFSATCHVDLYVYVHRVHRFDPGVYRYRGANLQVRCGPGPSGAEGGVAGRAEDDDSEPAGVERRAGAGSQRLVQGIGIV